MLLSEAKRIMKKNGYRLVETRRSVNFRRNTLNDFENNDVADEIEYSKKQKSAIFNGIYKNLLRYEEGLSTDDPVFSYVDMEDKKINFIELTIQVYGEDDPSVYIEEYKNKIKVSYAKTWAGATCHKLKDFDFKDYKKVSKFVLDFSRKYAEKCLNGEAEDE